ncbi:hypothetical protein G9A89_003533 [Geosiphon pyriformis]|nr:hypothetical protein G9A89_003533 [Geosiphon pyriformis]
MFKELNIQRAMFINNHGKDLDYISSIWGITQNAETLQYGIVMKFAEYGDMRKYCSTNFHSMTWSDKLEIAWSIASGLNSIHSSGMVHRNLHSGNILQLSTCEANIGDLRLCQPVNHKATTAEEKKIYGVIPYIPPEVLRGENFTTAGDMYSFAMLLWELATGKLPFHNSSHDAILIMAILNGQRPEITSPLIPPCIAEIIVKCWNVKPKNRPTANEVRNKLWGLVDICKGYTKNSKINRAKLKQFLESESAESDDFTTKSSEKGFVETKKPLGGFLKYIKFFKKTKKHEEIAKPSTATISIHPGAVYTSRLLTEQMLNFSQGWFI